MSIDFLNCFRPFFKFVIGLKWGLFSVHTASRCVCTVYLQYFFDPNTLQIMFYTFRTSNTIIVHHI